MNSITMYVTAYIICIDSVIVYSVYSSSTFNTHFKKYEYAEFPTTIHFDNNSLNFIEYFIQTNILRAVSPTMRLSC